MASTFVFDEVYGAYSSPVHHQTSYLNLIGADASSGDDTLTVPSAYPITIPASGYAYSYERWLRLQWSGTFSSISAAYFWKHSGTLSGALKIKARLKVSDESVYNYGAIGPGGPVNTASSWAGSAGNEATTTYDIPTATGSMPPGLAGTTTINSQYIILQLVVPTGSAVGAIGTMVYRAGWNEV